MTCEKIKKTYFLHIFYDDDWIFDDIYCLPKEIKSRVKSKLKAKWLADFNNVSAKVWEMSEYDNGKTMPMFSITQDVAILT